MDFNQLKANLRRLALAGGTLLLVACMSDDYDSNQIDLTMGFGTDGLTLPTNSTAYIPLADIIDADANGGSGLDTLANGDYVFRQLGGDVEEAHPTIDLITVRDHSSEAHNVYLTETSGAKAGAKKRAAAAKLTASGTVHVLDYEGDMPDEVVELKYATLNSEIQLTIDPTALAANVDEFATFNVYFPEFMTIGDVRPISSATGTLSGNKLSYTNVPTAEKFGIRATVTRISLEDDNPQYGSIRVADGRICVSGDIYVEATVESVKSYDNLSSRPITSQMSHNDFVITGGRGRFCPTIDLGDLGSAKISNIPDILIDDEGHAGVKLANPQLTLTLTSDMDVPATIDGTLTGIYSDGRAQTVVPVEGMRMKGNGTTTILIARTASGVDASAFDQVVEVPTLNKLTDEIPDEIKFTATVTADANTECDALLGHVYTVKPQYTMEMPLAFASDAQIVYRDTFDGWHDDIEDAEFDDNSSIGLTLEGTIVNRIPVNLEAKATAIDSDGNALDDYVDVVVTGNVAGSADGITPAESPLKIEISQTKAGGINKLDGIVFSATGTSGESMAGVTLNASKHALKADNIKVTVKGKYVGDFN